MTEQEGGRKVAELIKDIKVAMLTHIDRDGRLVSTPMATQDVEFDGDVWFVSERDSDKVRDIAAQNRVNVAYSGRGSWVSLSGTAEVVDDEERLRQYWGTFTDAWMEGGPDNPNNVLIHVRADTAEYWDTPGGAVTQVANLVKAKAQGERIEGDNEVVDL